jgi:hypothetical protein
MNHRLYLSCIFALFILFPIDGYAPCCIFTPPEQQLSGTGQRAFIVYNSQTQQVNMVPSINFNGDATDFAVVIPTPSVPKLDTVDRQLFWELDNMTRPLTRWRGGRGDSGCGGFGLGDDDDDAATESSGVDVISEQRVGAFDTAILRADNPMALIEWLDEHGYNHSIDDDSVLQTYIDQKWVFTAMRVNADRLVDERRRPGRFWNGTIDPVELRYTAASLIYPLHLTSISAPQGSDVTVYILAEHKMDFPGATVEYANQINDREQAAIRQIHPTFESFIGEQRYLTRLQRRFARTEMKIDFELVQHQNDHEFRRVQYLQMVYLLDYLLLSLAAIGYYLFRRVRLRRKTTHS